MKGEVEGLLPDGLLSFDLSTLIRYMFWDNPFGCCNSEIYDWQNATKFNTIFEPRRQ